MDIFVQSESSNCKSDLDKILLDISNVTFQGNPETPPVQAERVPGSELASICTPPPSLPLQNVAAYMAGYLVRKFKIKCTKCKEFLKINCLPESSEDSIYEFLRCKTYKETGCLVYPSEMFTKFFQNLEATFNLTFPSIMHKVGLIGSLCKSCEHFVDRLYLQTECDNDACKVTLHNIVKLYIKVKVHHVLKMNNIEKITSSNKRNRKILKLMHL